MCDIVRDDDDDDDDSDDSDDSDGGGGGGSSVLDSGMGLEGGVGAEERGAPGED